MVRIGIIGLGYWGPNLVRVLSNIPDCEVTALCDSNTRRLRKFCDKFPNAFGTEDKSQLFKRDLVDAVIIATPTSTHHAIAREALENGVHVFVEKPLASSTSECEELIQLAESKDLKLFVGHIFLYSAPVAKLRNMVATDELGEIYYMSSSRLNLGPVRQDVNALWDLAPHDVSIMIDLMGASPVSVNCSGLAYLNRSVHDVCTLTMHFENNRMGIVHVSWLDPHKKREMTVVGSKKMAVYNDIETQEKIKVYDVGVHGPSFCETYGDYQFSYRYGDMYSPRLDEIEPLRAECLCFIDSIVHNSRPKTDGYNGLEVVRVLESANHSLQNGNGRVGIDSSFRRVVAAPKQAVLT
jgi:predicted dehydrogenase